MASSGPLAGRTALITGASRGIGLACAELLHGAGARLVMLGRDVGALQQHTKRRGGSAGAIAVDLGDAHSVSDALAVVRDQWGAPDIIVNNAGQFLLNRVEATSPQEFTRILAVNLTSQHSIVREFLPDMRKKQGGHIVTVGSLADRQALPYNSAYAASKHGVRALHESLREELRGTGVRVTLISPEHVDTQLWDDVPGELSQDLVPRDRMIEAVDVAESVMFALTRPPEVNVDELRLSRS